MSQRPPVRSPSAWRAPNEAALFVLAVVFLAAYQLAPRPIELLAALAYLAIACWQPRAALPAAIVALPFYTLPRPIAGGWSMPAFEAGIWLTFVAVAFRWGSSLLADHRLAPGGWRPRQAIASLLVSLDWIDLAAGALVLLGFVSLVPSVARVESLRALRTIIIEPVLFYYLATRLAAGSAQTGRAFALRLAGALLLAGVAVSLVGFYQYATNQNIITAEENLRRIRAFYGSPNNLALFLGRVAPLALALAAFGRFGQKARLACWLAFAATGLAIVLTFSIGAWLGVLAALLVIAALAGRKALIRTAIGLGVAALAAAPVLLSVERFRSHLDLTDGGTTFARVVVWWSALAMIRDHPLLGIGLDNFLYYYRDLHYMLPAGWREPALSHPHNLLLDFWLSLGLLGAGLLVVLLVGFGREALRLWRAESDPVARGLVAGVLASMVDFLAHGLIDNSYFLPDLAVLFWLCFVILRLSRATSVWRARPAAIPFERSKSGSAAALDLEVAPRQEDRS